ncbi:DNA (cytosine-5-)-methyltransferase [Clostridium botulinum]|uniref:DNA (cytosine-5-)-methyltransferase n=1 Tax=Clostridium botulinum TaxID=1491 RepID=UPI000773597C|nr:DNA (cytosine-5-)-methyltransferase [Clostridium botulinum]NFS28127.1 DNA (cytosine-5-)-methyltransferase [Clostridium botulinum]NFS54171.1 DNA (cytosine-5-)-methyltransferase [Clostridium botulinum]NFT17080.1 DNA (cytosine-5-)-methyltransferase [Clostridium botulinum]
MSNVYKVGSLFAGVGGVCLGFQNAKVHGSRYELVWANEMDEYACETYKNNFEHKLIQGDINKVLNPEKLEEELLYYIKTINQTDDLEIAIDKQVDSKIRKTKQQLDKFNIIEKPKIKEMKQEIDYYKKKHEEILEYKIDVLLGGFPCQAFSIAGERKGFEDDRGNLFLSIINLINQLQKKHGTDGKNGINGKPRILFLENVKNLKGHDGGRTYEIIKSELEKTGYIIKEHVLNTMDYSDLPQNRERIYIIGFLYKEDAEKFDLFHNIDEFKKIKTSENRIEDIKKVIDYDITKKTHEKYYYTKSKYPNYFITEEEYKLLSVDKRKAERVNLDEQINEMYQFYQVRRGMYVRKNMSGVCPTLTANMGTGGHNVPLIKVKDGIRKLTPNETFKLQGFPIGNGYKLPIEYKGRIYSDSHLYKQSGNAVSVPVVEFLAREIIKVLY